MRIAKQKVKIETLLLAAIADRLSVLVYRGTEDAKHKRNPPVSIVNALITEEQTEKVKAFKSGADFDAEYKRITGGE